MKVKDAVKRISAIRQKWDKAFAESKKKAEKDISKSGWAHWATWNLQDIIFHEHMSAEWKGIETGAKSLEGVTSDVFVAAMKSLREEYYVRHILASDLTNRSTSAVGNLVSDINQQVHKNIAGHNILDSDSLMAIIIEMEMTK